MSLELRRRHALIAMEQKLMSPPQKLELAMRKYDVQRRIAGHDSLTARLPRVMVMKSKNGSQVTYVLEMGGRCVSARSWENLIHKAAFTYWKRWSKSIYAKRLEKTKNVK